MVTSVKEIMLKAQEGGYAVGAFNTLNLEMTQAILEAAKETRSPVIVQITEKSMEYAGGRALYNIVKNIAEFYAPEVPVGIHLDHGKSIEAVQRCVNIGFNSVMYDGSRKSLEDNTMLTKQVVEYCKDKNITVQGELGSVPYIGETDMTDIIWDKYMTVPSEAKIFVEQTGIDTLAVAIGNAHGFFKERSVPDYARLEEIRKVVSVPLVLHGASDWENDRVQEVIKRGICCFNVDTATRVAFMNNLMKTACNNGTSVTFDIRKVLGDAREAAKLAIIQKMQSFGSAGRI
ncbi:MAG: class II fructose-bisphosphate aldolase [Candidatus Moranbacteria bacterium]|nr:class II fructose-bisphosphate aldolase [Candidatus Moranbacteria bacterium]